MRTSTLQKTSLTDSVSVNGTVKSGYEASVTVADSAKLYKVSEVKVAVGDTVKKGDVVLIIESMKLMNEVTSDVDGVVQEILVKNGDAVEYDQPLMILS